MDKNARGARIFAKIAMKLGGHDLCAQRQRCKNGQKCAQIFALISMKLCANANEWNLALLDR